MVLRRDRSAGPAVVTLCEDGPYLIRGDFELRGQDGDVIDPRRPAVALCRCGRSRLRPFCDGTHRVTRFRALGTSEKPPASDIVDSSPEHHDAAAVASDPSQTLEAVVRARSVVLSSLAEQSHAVLRRTEPLLAAAEALLAWQLDAPDHPTGVVYGDGSDLAAARLAVGRALRSAVGLKLADAATADLVRSLLRDAASALRPAAHIRTNRGVR